MDSSKRKALKDRLRDQPEPQYAPIREFLDGNDDEGSIGCNLLDHPGIPAFRSAFEQIANRPDVEGVWAQISELDPGDDYWPFSDLVVVAGKISIDDLRRLVASLQPDDVAEAADYGVSDELAAKHARLLAVWWD